MLLEYNKVNNELKCSPCPIFQCHIVYYNADKYSSFADASKSADGLGIVAVLCNVSTCIFSFNKTSSNEALLIVKLVFYG